MEPQLPPLILCMENMNGEEVSLSIGPNDDFQTFLDKAKSTLGFDVDINSITGEQPVSLNENIYHYLLNSELNYQTDPQIGTENFQRTPEQGAHSPDGFVYVLDDGTQIRASQIHFDNEDPPLDLIAEQIPFVKYADDSEDENEVVDQSIENTKKINIVESPVKRWESRNSSPRCSFVNSLPFKLVCSNTSNFEAQFTKYLESSTTRTFTTLNPVTNRNKSPKSLISDNYKNYDENYQRNKDDFGSYTREEILNMFKDSPVASLPYEENQNHNEKRRHVRKTDPSRLHKNWNNRPYVDVKPGEKGRQNCFICGKIDNNIEKLYLFDNEDQKLHRCTSPRNYPTQLKIICDHCLAENFKPSRMKSPTQSLSTDEFLVIKNNQQFIFQKVIDFKLAPISDIADKRDQNLEDTQENEKLEFVKVEIGSDGEIVTKCIDNDTRSSDDVIIVKDEKKDSSSDVEIIENEPYIDDHIIDNLEEADEDVKEFLGKYHCDNNTEIKELKCRFCDSIFEQIGQVIDHGEEHKHNLNDGEVFPCPLCDYGYSNFKWLKGHLKAAHDKTKITDIKNEADNDEDKNEAKTSPSSSPVAKRTRSAIKKVETETEKGVEIMDNSKFSGHNMKQECLDSSDDEAIWIVQTVGHEPSAQLENLLKVATGEDKDEKNRKKNKCNNCSQIFPTAESLISHKCRRRGRKRRGPAKDDSVLLVPSEEDFLRRAQGRPKQKQSGVDNDLLVVRSRKRKNREPTSDPQIVTCHNCNESFTSKVRLKFHMQFHDATNLLTAEGQYACPECEGAHFPTESELFDHVHFQHHKQKRWQCPVEDCGKTFYLRATLTKHSRTHTDTRRYVCVTCGKRFLDKQTLDEHGVTHLQIKPFQCHICLKQLTRRSRLRMHLRAHEEELAPRLVLVCAACGRAFRDTNDAQDHANKSKECIEKLSPAVKEENQVSVLLSPTTGLVTQTVAVVAKSPQMECGPEGDALLATLTDFAKIIIRVVEIEKAFRCEYSKSPQMECGPEGDALLATLTDFAKIIIRVVEIEKAFRCEYCEEYLECGVSQEEMHGKTGPEDGGGTTKIARDDYRIPCRDCSMVLPNKTALYAHRQKEHSDTTMSDEQGTDAQVRTHAPLATSCSKCGHNFNEPSALQRHLKEVHGHEGEMRGERGRSHACAVCGRTFRSASVRNEHLRVHTGERPYPCDVCGVAFRRSTAMRNHRLIHSGVRAWACARCPKRFRIRSDLRTHMRLKHPTYMIVFEMKGLNPTYEEIMQHIRENNITQGRIIEITKMSFEKGTSSIVPTTARALSLLGHVPRTKITCETPTPVNIDMFQPARRGRGIAKNPRRPKILQGGHGDSELVNEYSVPVTCGTSGEIKRQEMRLLPCIKSYDEGVDHSKQIDREIKEWIKTYNEAIKLLLLGTGESGKTTIIKQMKILHVKGFSHSERTAMIPHIRFNTHEAIYEIIHNMPVLSIGLQNPKHVRAQEYLLKVGPEGPQEYTEEYFDNVRDLWQDAGVRECFRRANEYQLIDSAEYFLDRIDLIGKEDYVPSDADILRCRRKTTGIQKIEFKVKVPKSMHGGTQDFWMFDVGGQRGERKKWIQNLTTKKRERRQIIASAERFVVLEASRARECYFHFTTATDTHNVRTVFRDVHQMILTHILSNIGVY
ncbi:Guanine nucleotide-binding protein G(f) subunit alpha [Papilio machaon]|uniref:Guanine nucleotide-binding protein G(F) subunit alpha n=1 Tax=Papilio machaon TaxID=76193 RepID=A0A0N1IIE7_PAPMA|nr:Guanine nucleotide-binding protein G(f) subunit alpha [Papilio machaon]